MAIYVADYQTDLGKLYQKRVLFSSLINNLSEISFTTTYDFDLPYLPQIFQSQTLTKLQYKNSCTLRFQPRLFRLFLTETKYLSLPCPFMPTSTNYLLFEQQIANNSLIIHVEKTGEIISDSSVYLQTKNG